MQLPEHAGVVKALVAPKTPAGQGVHTEEASTLYFPSIHGLHVAGDAAPHASINFPASQGVQLVVPLKVEYRPGWQRKQELAPPVASGIDKNLPATQFTHEVAFTKVYVPAGQGMQEVAPAEGATEPPGQGEQASAYPLLLAKVPGSHAVQLGALGKE